MIAAMISYGYLTNEKHKWKYTWLANSDLLHLDGTHYCVPSMECNAY